MADKSDTTTEERDYIIAGKITEGDSEGAWRDLGVETARSHAEALRRFGSDNPDLMALYQPPYRVTTANAVKELGGEMQTRFVVSG